MITGSHVVYTSGKHGSAYVNKDAVYPNTARVAELCRLPGRRRGAATGRRSSAARDGRHHPRAVDGRITSALPPSTPRSARRRHGAPARLRQARRGQARARGRGRAQHRRLGASDADRGGARGRRRRRRGRGAREPRRCHRRRRRRAGAAWRCSTSRSTRGTPTACPLCRDGVPIEHGRRQRTRVPRASRLTQRRPLASAIA